MTRRTPVPAVIVALALWPGTFCLATEEYAEDTNKDCASCHISASGGGELTQAGEAYMTFLELAPKEVGTGPDGGGETQQQQDTGPLVGRIVRLAVAYVHVFTGLFWFGTILYVHIVFKPAYAARGLPPAEVKVGLISIAIMGVTGAALTIFRVPSPAFFLQTRFGVLLMIKIGIYLTMVVSALIAVLLIGPRLRKRNAAPRDSTPSGTFTAEQLAAFDGTDGGSAYVAYDGGVYDVTASRSWLRGSHLSKHQAGRDLTAMLAQAPHTKDRILMMPRVGSLAAPDETAKRSPTERMFYFMAYFNLVNVGLVILVLVLWRWW